MRKRFFMCTANGSSNKQFWDGRPGAGGRAFPSNTRRQTRERGCNEDEMHAIPSSAVSLLVPTPTFRSLSPFDISTGTRYPSPSDDDSEDQLHEGLLVLIPVALVVFIIGTLLVAYKWQRAERGNSDGSLCQVWRRRIGRRRSPRERGNPAAVCGRVTTLGK